MIFALVLWVLALVCHGVSLGCIGRELLWEYRFRAWEWAWVSLGLAKVLGAVGWGMALWVTWAHAPGLLIAQGIVLLLMSACACSGYWGLSRIFHRGVSALLARPAHIVIDQESRILAWDSVAETMFGWTTAEAEGQTLLRTIIPVRTWETHTQAMDRYRQQHGQRHDGVRTLMLIARHKDGHEFPVEVSIAVTMDAAGAYQFHGSVRRLVVL